LGKVPTYFWTYAWQEEKKSRKIKQYAKSKSFVMKSKIALDLLQEHYQLSAQEFQELKTKFFAQLDCIVQSSALVETINSLLRPYMNEAKNQLSQEQLNIIRFYLNHRVYQRGKRKGAAPIELLRGEKLDKSWSELLLEFVQ
jgi:DNA/RNA endonuclease G (NUC1)